MIIRKTDKIPNKYIPIILLPLGILGAMGIMGFTVKAAIQGILITGAAVYGDQVYKQMTKRKNSKFPNASDGFFIIDIKHIFHPFKTETRILKHENPGFYN